jgi:F-type H+-transporting ATPase subunit b
VPASIAVIADSSTKLVLPATNELIWGTIAFLLFIAVLWRFGVWRRLGQAMEDRAARIRTDLEKAEQARKDADRLLEQYREQMERARAEAQSLLEEARQRAEEVRRDLVAKAEAESQRIVENARREIQAERTRAARELRREVGQLAVEVAERIVGGSLDGDRQLALVDSYVEELSSQAPNGNGKRAGNGNGDGNGDGGSAGGGRG